tara:strand:+ start:675 stop:1061 length:387 start_codon:yes stop_codon:yes gene_type:complete
MTDKVILNLTQHKATAEQLEAGVEEPIPVNKQEIQKLLTFESIPTKEVIEERARQLSFIAKGYLRSKDAYTVMIGGAPFLMAALEKALRAENLDPVYAFSKRESTEVDDGTGGVRKVAIFRHLGFVTK